MPAKNSDSQATNGKNALEWTVFAFSLALISSMFVYMGIQAYGNRNVPARLKITLGAPTKSESMQMFPVSVENLGQTTAANVEIEVTSRHETSGFTLDHVPREGHAQGFVTFRQPVVKSQLKARVVGYTE